MPLVVFWFYLVTCVAAGLLGLVQPTLAIDPVIVQLNQFGPAVGVLAVLLVWRRWRPPLATGFGLSRHVLIGLVVLVVLAGVIFAVFVGLTELAGVSRHGIRPEQLPYPFWLILAAQLIGACGEEFGWRCFLQPYLRVRFGVLSSGTLVGLLWGVWHVQAFSRGRCTPPVSWLWRSRCRSCLPCCRSSPATEFRSSLVASICSSTSACCC